MAIFKINNVDFSDLVSGLKVSYETLVSDNSGRNANGDTVLDVINLKRKIHLELRHTTFTEMQSFLAAIAPYQVEVEYLDPRDNTLQNAFTYTGTPEPEYFNVSRSIFKPLKINFIEL